eukprot:106752-Hanusia_phi.AAC.1
MRCFAVIVTCCNSQHDFPYLSQHQSLVHPASDLLLPSVCLEASDPLWYLILLLTYILTSDKEQVLDASCSATMVALVDVSPPRGQED